MHRKHIQFSLFSVSLCMVKKTKIKLVECKLAVLHAMQTIIVSAQTMHLQRTGNSQSSLILLCVCVYGARLCAEKKKGGNICEGLLYYASWFHPRGSLNHSKLFTTHIINVPKNIWQPMTRFIAGCKLWLLHGATSSWEEQTFAGSLQKQPKQQWINEEKTLKCAQGLQKQKSTPDLAVWTLLVASNNKTRLKNIANQMNKSTFIRFKSQKSSAGESPGYCKCNRAKLALPLKNNRLFQMCFFSDSAAKTYICAFPKFHSIRTWHIFISSEWPPLWIYSTYVGFRHEPAKKKKCLNINILTRH